MQGYDKYPYKKMLYLNWLEAAIAQLLLFKYLKEKTLNKAYFLISEQGVLLKAATQATLKSTEDEINKFFTAKIQQLQTSCSNQLYDRVIDDIREETDRLKDSCDCPYINLIYSDKLKHSCLALKKFGYSKPYEQWQIHEREHRNFAFLVVRPQHRWKQIANNVLALIKKRENTHLKSKQTEWASQLTYEVFLWLYLSKNFKALKGRMQISEKRVENRILVVMKKATSQWVELTKQFANLQWKYTRERIDLKELESGEDQVIQLSSFEIQKITELIYHQFGLPGFVKEMRRKALGYLLIGNHNGIVLGNLSKKNTKCFLADYPYMRQIDPGALTEMLFFGRNHRLVTFEGGNYVVVRYQKPPSTNLLNIFKVRLPCLPRYFYWYEEESCLFLLRKYEQEKLKVVLPSKTEFQQAFLMCCLMEIAEELHKRYIYIGEKFIKNVYVDERRVVVEPGEEGNLETDQSKLKIHVREWVKYLPVGELKQKIGHLDDLCQISTQLKDYIECNI